jgi:hypothetical protein
VTADPSPAELAEIAEMRREVRAACGPEVDVADVLALALIRTGTRMRAFRRVDPRGLALTGAADP